MIESFDNFVVQPITDVEAFGRGPLRHQGTYLTVSFAFPQHAETWRRERGHWRAAIERLVQSETEERSPVVWITDNWSCGYFHWIGDALPRLELASRSHDLSKLTLLLPYKYRTQNYMPQSLQPFGLKEVRFLRRFERVHCREMVLPPHVKSTGVFDGSIIADMRQRFLSYLNQTASPEHEAIANHGERIYISRTKAPKRRVRNEDEIVPVLRNHGFTVLTAESHDWAYQTRVAAGAKFLVSNHGAGLTNMLMMEPESHVLEILDDVGRTPACYQSLADASKLDYASMTATRVNRNQSVHHGDVWVDPEKLDAAIDVMIRRH